MKFIFPAMLTFAGLMFLTIAWRSGGQTLRILQTGTKTQGIVIENALRPTRVNERYSATARAPVVRFKTQTGQETTFYSTDYLNPALYEVGQTVDIWYMPGNPQQASLKSNEVWILPGVFGAFGLAALLLGLPMLLRVLFKR